MSGRKKKSKIITSGGTLSGGSSVQSPMRSPNSLPGPRSTIHSPSPADGGGSRTAPLILGSSASVGKAGAFAPKYQFTGQYRNKNPTSSSPLNNRNNVSSSINDRSPLRNERVSTTRPESPPHLSNSLLDEHSANFVKFSQGKLMADLSKSAESGGTTTEHPLFMTTSNDHGTPRTRHKKPARIGSAGTTHSVISLASAATLVTDQTYLEQQAQQAYSRTFVSSPATRARTPQPGGGALQRPPLNIGRGAATPLPRSPVASFVEERGASNEITPLPKNRQRQKTSVSSISAMSALMNADLDEAYRPIQGPLPGLPLLGGVGKGSSIRGLPPQGAKEPGDKIGGATPPLGSPTTASGGGLTADDIFEQLRLDREKLTKDRDAAADEKKKNQARLFGYDEHAYIKKSHTVETITKLRKDENAMQEFTTKVDDLTHERRQKQRAAQKFNVKDRAVEFLDTVIPEVRKKRLEEEGVKRDERLERAKEKRRELKDEKRQHKEALLTRTFAPASGYHDVPVVDYRLDDVSWITMLTATVFAQKLHARFAKEKKVIHMHHQHFELDMTIRVIRRIQVWWKRKYWVLLLLRRKRAVDVIKAGVTGASRLKVWFRIGLHRLVQAVRRMQLHWRAVFRVRALRLQRAVEHLTVITNREVRHCEKSLFQCSKDMRLFDTKLRAAISARKPEFETKIKQCEARIVDLRKGRTVYGSLTEQNKKDMVCPLLAKKYGLYKTAVKPIAAKMFDKFQALHSMHCLARRKGAQYQKLLTENSIVDVKLLKSKDYDSMKRIKFDRPDPVSLAIAMEEAQHVFDELGWEFGEREYEENKEAMMARDLESLSQALSVNKSLRTDVAQANAAENAKARASKKSAPMHPGKRRSNANDHSSSRHPRPESANSASASLRSDRGSTASTAVPGDSESAFEEEGDFSFSESPSSKAFRTVG